MSIWQWLLAIGNEDALIASLLKALAAGQPIDAIGDADRRAELLALFVERDLLRQDDEGAYRFRVPLIARWIKSRPRL